MQVVMEAVEQSTISEFADKHGLVMQVRERRVPVGSPNRYFASFMGAEVKLGPVLAGSYGDGATPEDAITAYAKEIELKRLVIGAYTDERREIDVPRLV